MDRGLFDRGRSNQEEKEYSFDAHNTNKDNQEINDEVQDTLEGRVETTILSTRERMEAINERRLPCQDEGEGVGMQIEPPSL